MKGLVMLVVNTGLYQGELATVQSCEENLYLSETGVHTHIDKLKTSKNEGIYAYLITQ